MIKEKRKLVSDIKILKANHKTLKEFAKTKYIDEEKNANIHIYINNSDLYDSYSNPNKPELSSDFIEHIEKDAFFIPVEYPLILHIHSRDSINLNYVNEKLKEHYWKELANKDAELKKNRWISRILLMLGILFLALYFFLEFREGTNVIFAEIFSITGSFAVWEAVDYALLNRGALRIERLNLAQLALIELKMDKVD